MFELTPMANVLIKIDDRDVDRARARRKMDDVSWHNRTANDLVLEFPDPFIAGQLPGARITAPARRVTGPFPIDGTAGTKIYNIIETGQAPAPAQDVLGTLASIAPRTGTIDIG